MAHFEHIFPRDSGIGVAAQGEYAVTGEEFASLRVVYPEQRRLVTEVTVVVDHVDHGCNTEDTDLHRRSFLVEEPDFLHAEALHIGKVDVVAHHFDVLLVSFRVEGHHGVGFRQFGQHIVGAHTVGELVVVGGVHRQFAIAGCVGQNFEEGLFRVSEREVHLFAHVDNAPDAFFPENVAFADGLIGQHAALHHNFFFHHIVERSITVFGLADFGFDAGIFNWIGFFGSLCPECTGKGSQEKTQASPFKKCLHDSR